MKLLTYTQSKPNETTARCNGRLTEYLCTFNSNSLSITRCTSSYYMDEDYPARPEIQQPLFGWGNKCGSESSIVEIVVCVWRYAPLMVHATQEGVYST